MAPVLFGSVCSGIEAASVAWGPLGWRAAWVSEIEAFPSAVLAHHYPDAPNLGDMTTIARRVLTGEVAAPDVLCGGTPCQAFSVAGLRQSLGDERGNLTLKFVELADAVDHVRARDGKPAAIIVWENVPGVLSTKDNAFGCFLAGLAGEDGELQPPGGRWEDAGAVYGPARAICWRTLDAQYFGLAQRRRRVFVVASARDDLDPAAVLFEWQGLRRDTAPRREAGQSAAATLDARADGGGFPGTDGACGGHVQPVVGALTAAAGPNGHGGSGLATDKGAEAGHILAFGGNRTSGPIDVAPALNACGTASGRQDFESEAFITTAHTLRGEGFDASEDGTGRGTPLVPVAYTPELHPTMVARSSRGGGQTNSPGHNADETLIAFTQNSRSEVRQIGGDGRLVGALAADAGAQQQNYIAFSSKDHGADATPDLAPTLRAMGHDGSHANGGGQMAAQTAMQVRRLTPRECERLQGFPDDYTLIPWRGKPAADCPDGPRYKALGNSWAVPVVRWIGRRIDEALTPPI